LSGWSGLGLIGSATEETLVPALDKLLEISGPALISAALPDGLPALKQFGGMGAELDALLRRRNGFFAFESALHLFPFGRADGILDLETWNAASTWRNEYGGGMDGCLVFAEDAFGFPFCIEAGAISSCDAETGVRTRMASSLEDWAGRLLVDWRVLTGHPVAHAWQTRFGPLEPGRRLAPRQPFVLGGDSRLDNLYAADQVELMRFRGSLATQIRDVPDGARVTLKVTR
jgi:hypothetical protein